MTILDSDVELPQTTFTYHRNLTQEAADLYKANIKEIIQTEQTASGTKFYCENNANIGAIQYQVRVTEKHKKLFL